MQRRIYRAVLKECNESKGIDVLKSTKTNLQSLADAEKIYYPSIFRYENQVFLYFEFAEAELFPEDFLQEANAHLEIWPGFEGKRKWVLMHDVFHYQQPQSVDEWKRKTKVESFWCRVIRLKPEMISSYIFYHYQYQEENPGLYNKYGIIGIHDNLLFMYIELPDYTESISYKGLLDTSNTPEDWGPLMENHFSPWPDSKGKDDFWRDAEILVSLI